MRINKYLAHQKISTRDGADKMVSAGLVFINGKRALLGSKVNENDKVEIKGNVNPKKYIYYAYNKPIGLETPEISIIKNVFPIGRLDKNSHGLIILTNDGRITDLLLNPKYVHEKEYMIKTKEKLRSSFKQKMEAGVILEGMPSKALAELGYQTKPCKVQIINENMFKIILTEGKKHQIRRMCSALFQEVADLKRTRIMNIELGNLKPNTSREIKGAELATFLKSMGIK